MDRSSAGVGLNHFNGKGAEHGANDLNVTLNTTEQALIPELARRIPSSRTTEAGRFVRDF
jgi:hypothetical protein